MPKTSRSARKKVEPKRIPKPKHITDKALAAASKKLVPPPDPERTPITARGVKRLNYKNWRHNRRVHIRQQIHLVSIWYMCKTSARLLWKYKYLFLGIVLVYGILNLLFVHGLSNGTTVSTLKSEIGTISAGHFSGVVSSLTIYANYLGSAGSGSTASAGVYESVLVIMVSLALIWALRQVLAGHVKVRVRDAYYKGMYPLVPSILVLIVVGFQLIPLLLGASMFAIVQANDIATNFFEQFCFGLISGLLALWTLYLVSSSLFALYIVTLPDMTPMKALRTARLLVKYRRWTILRKVLVLPVLLLVLSAALMLPVILFLAPIAQWVFFILTMLAFAVVHAYMYTLYRELLNERVDDEQ